MCRGVTIGRGFTPQAEYLSSTCRVVSFHQTMEKDFAGRTAFVTGSAQGIGLATATILASRGANIALADMQLKGVEKAAQSLAEQYGVKTLPLQLDVTDPEQVDKAIASTVAHFGRLDHAVNAAGIAGLRGVGAVFAEYPTDDWNLVMNVNCNGVFYCCRAEISAMLKAGTKGSIVNIASTAGLIALPTQGIAA
jgi:NAD(P)-dependent dehydrogenase (short-subunit alcohol dehydrogenase family)